MRKIFTWSEWSITSKILFTFLILSAISMGIVGYLAMAKTRELGNYAMDTNTFLGQSAIQDSTTHLNKLGEETMTQKAHDVAKQVEMYLNNHPGMTANDMRTDQELRNIVVQPVGKTGYTTLIDSNSRVIIIHKYWERETNILSMKEYLPSFWRLLDFSTGGTDTAGYYDWQEVDGTMRQKFASISPVSYGGQHLTLWATTYIEEFSAPAEETKKEINAAIENSRNFISGTVSTIQNTFSIVFTFLIIILIGIALLLSRIITRPILELKMGAEAIGKGELGYRVKVKSHDELGDLANTFNIMSSDLKNYTDELKSSADERLIQEKKIQENLRLYVQNVSQAQEAERKRIARELHDDTAQALVAVLRHIDDLATGKSKISITDIRQEVRKILEGVRQFSQELRPSILDDLGLVPSIKWLASDLAKNSGVAAEAEIIGEQRQLSSETELMLFRITQEALTNVRKHSEATQVSVKLNFLSQNVKVVIQDNGKGFELTPRIDELSRLGKLGLVGMEERAQLLGGTLNVESKP
jgi:signal transduction histidine kinase